MKFLKALIFALLIGGSTVASTIHIIPEPVEIIEKKGVFHFNRTTRILIKGDTTGFATIFKSFVISFNRASGILLTISQKNSKADSLNVLVIELNHDPSIKNNEGYIIEIDKNQIHISAPALAGIFYAIETIKQLLPPEFYSKSNISGKIRWQIPCASILDYPQYSFRGMNLDVSRHFFPVSFIKKYLDILSNYKFNIFHWHLTDSHGWRIEIKQYPKLTSVGAWRANRKDIPMTIAEPTGKNEPATYGGYYTQEEIKDIIQYAKERFITIIPEIEMPGHCTAALVAYPEYNCLHNKYPLLIPCGYPGDLQHNFCVGYDSTYIFLQNILKEVMQLFPSPYIHIGGDEVRGGPWLTCPRCMKRMEENGFKTAKQLQTYFTKRIDSFITANNKRTIGWDEILLANISPGAVAMAWHGTEETISDLQSGHEIIMSPYHYTYFDFYQSDPDLEEYITYAGLFLDTVYAFIPSSPAVTDLEKRQILGGEGSLWTENVETEGRVEYMLLPRLFALSEDLWSVSGNKNYRRFIDKTEDEFKRLDMQHIHYAKSMYNPSISPHFDNATKKIIVSINNQVAGKYNIRYTLNGKEPEYHSLIYKSPLVISKSVTLQTALFKEEKRLGKINKQRFTVHSGIGSIINILPNSSDEEISSEYKRLNDGIFGTIEPYDGRWVSFHDSVKTITIDLGKSRNIKNIFIRFMEDQVSDIYLPKKIDFSVSVEGSHYRKFHEVLNKSIPEKSLRHIVIYKQEAMNLNGRYIRICIKNANLNSDDQTKNNFLLDEIVIQ
ncbi:MAG TPA: family 20 glycosylhydrolase [Puia sp.]|nr:family 20 glycosylhydrolase [Puia sp.]